MTRLVCELAVETGISPRELAQLDHTELVTIIEVINARAKEARKGR